MMETKRLKSVLIESSTNTNLMSYCIIREKKLKKVVKREQVGSDKLLLASSSHNQQNVNFVQRYSNKSRAKDVNKRESSDHAEFAIENPQSPMMISAKWLSQSSSAIDSTSSDEFDGKTRNFTNDVLAHQENKSLPSSSVQSLPVNPLETLYSSTTSPLPTNNKCQPTTKTTTACQSIDKQKRHNLHDTISNNNPPEKFVLISNKKEGRNFLGLSKRSNCLSFILALIVLCLTVQNNNHDSNFLQQTREDVRQERSTNYPEALYNAITNLAQEFLIKQSPKIIFAEAQYKPEWPSKTLQQEIFLLNLEDGYFGCQVNESQDFLQLFELSRLCDGQTQCYLGTDEMAAPLKCNNRERCGTYQNSRSQQENIQCVNGVCLDGLCYCNDGFGGKSCDVPDENECKFRPCDVFAHCTNTMGSYYCSCFPGYDGDGMHCQDINECEIPSLAGLCSSNSECLNLPGHFVCRCKFGYEQLSQSQSLTGNNASVQCIDIDECLREDACGSNQYCINTDGSHECRCKSGFIESRGASNQTACVDIDECLSQPCGPSAVCRNEIGSFKCSCNDGLIPIDQDPINGCKSPCDGVNCGPHATCKSHSREATCVCTKPGFTSDPITGECIDIDECLRNETCGPSAVCRNEIGSFKCSCKKGYIGNAYSSEGCQDVDECLGQPCGPSAVCQNEIGSFRCSCNDGLVPIDKDPINGCKSPCDGVNCGPHATCKSLNQEAACVCLQGYEQLKGAGNQTACVDIDECLGKPCGRGAACQNEIGSFRCSCNDGLIPIDQDPVNGCKSPCDGVDCGPHAACKSHNQEAACVCKFGFSFDPDNIKLGCVDIDECLGKPCGRGAVCQNKIGSFRCLCNDGLVPIDKDPINGCKSPCDGVNCGPHATCKSHNREATCACKFGFISEGSGNQTVCVDIDECLGNPCGFGAACQNKIGSFRCSCNDGLIPIDQDPVYGCKSPCDGINCGPHATCQLDNLLQALCVCDSGYMAPSDGRSGCILTPPATTTTSTTSSTMTTNNSAFGNYQQEPRNQQQQQQPPTTTTITKTTTACSEPCARGYVCSDGHCVKLDSWNQQQQQTSTTTSGFNEQFSTSLAGKQEQTDIHRTTVSGQTGDLSTISFEFGQPINQQQQPIVSTQTSTTSTSSLSNSSSSMSSMEQLQRQQQQASYESFQREQQTKRPLNQPMIAYELPLPTTPILPQFSNFGGQTTTTTTVSEQQNYSLSQQHSNEQQKQINQQRINQSLSSLMPQLTQTTVSNQQQTTSTTLSKQQQQQQQQQMIQNLFSNKRKPTQQPSTISNANNNINQQLNTANNRQDIANDLSQQQQQFELQIKNQIAQNQRQKQQDEILQALNQFSNKSSLMTTNYLFTHKPVTCTSDQHCPGNLICLESSEPGSKLNEKLCGCPIGYKREADYCYMHRVNCTTSSVCKAREECISSAILQQYYASNSFQQQITATIGSQQFSLDEYHGICVCPKHFRLTSSGTACEDVNECDEGTPCAVGAICKNLIGSYECVCPPNMAFLLPEGGNNTSLDPTKMACEPIDVRNQQQIPSTTTYAPPQTTITNIYQQQPITTTTTTQRPQAQQTTTAVGIPFTTLLPPMTTTTTTIAPFETTTPELVEFRTIPPSELFVMCLADGIQVEVQLGGFDGIIYVKGHSQDPKCRKLVMSSNANEFVDFKVQFGHCDLIHRDGEAGFVLVIQKHPKLVTYRARAYHVKCVYNTGERTVTLGFNVSMITTSGTIANTGPPPTCLMSITALDGREVTSAEIGQDLLLRVDVQPDSIYGGFARSCEAKTMDDEGEYQYEVTDSNGCATDPSIFSDWKYDQHRKSLVARFNAFKFPSSNNLRFQCNIRVCFGSCPAVNCNGIDAYGKRRKRRQAPSIGEDTLRDGDGTILYNNNTNSILSSGNNNTNPSVDFDSPPTDELIVTDAFKEGALREEIMVQSNAILTFDRKEASLPQQRPQVEDIEFVCLPRLGIIMSIVLTTLLALLALAIATSCWCFAKRKRQKRENGPLPHPVDFPNPLLRSSSASTLREPIYGP